MSLGLNEFKTYWAFQKYLTDNIFVSIPSATTEFE
jgi:hypothetical protein